MKLKLFLTYYLLLFIILGGIIPNVYASGYKIGTSKGDEFIWKCDVCNIDELKEILGNKWDEEGLFENLKEETRLKLVITDTDENTKSYSTKTEDNETAFNIKFAKWIWTHDEKWGERDRVDELSHFKNPKDYEEDLIFFQFAPIWLPLPLGEYLKEIDLYKGYTIDARVLPSITCEIDKGDIDDEYPKKYIKVVAMYNDKGFLTSYKLYINDHRVLIDISLETFITINFIFLSIITAIIYFAILYLIYKGLKT